MRITQNLSGARIRLRAIDRTRILLADAICINRKNSDEKSHLLEVMSDQDYRLGLHRHRFLSHLSYAIGLYILSTT
jgi:hypothetical protein